MQKFGEMFPDLLHVLLGCYTGNEDESCRVLGVVPEVDLGPVPRKDDCVVGPDRPVVTT